MITRSVAALLLAVPMAIAQAPCHDLQAIATVQQEHFPELLRYHMQTLHPQVRSARLFKLVRDSVKRAP